MSKIYQISLIILLTLVSILAWVISYRSGVSLAYNDAMSHINISRFVVDNMEPGLSQLGSVWLPLTHVLPLLFVWNDWAWHSGFAASVFSMLSYVISTICIYITVKELTQKYLPSLLSASVFALNLNMLYLQTTPLTEPMYVMFFVLSFFLFVRWIRSGQTLYVLLLGIVGFLQVLTRYDGWFVVGVESLCIWYYEYMRGKDGRQAAIGKALLFTVPVMFGMGLWFLWNALIFNNPLYFAIGPYSAHAQQATLATKNLLITKGNIWISLKAYWYAMSDTVGREIMLLGSIGLVMYMFYKKRTIDQSALLVSVAFLLAPVIFNVLSLYIGFSSLNVPELHWNPSGSPQGYWFNVRYGILSLPLAAIGIGLFAQWKRYLPALLVIELLIWNIYQMYPNNIITLIDGTKGSSAYTYQDVSTNLRTSVKPDEIVLMSLSTYNPVAFQSHVQLSHVLHEGVSKKWHMALKNPQAYAQWIVMAASDRGDPVYTELVKHDNGSALQAYIKVFEGHDTVIYHLKSAEMANK